MSASRKRPTPSPPVQAQGPPQARTPQYQYQPSSEWAGGRGHQEDPSRQAQQQPNFVQGYPQPVTWEYQNYPQSGGTHDQLNQQTQVPGQNQPPGVQNMMYAQGRPNTYVGNQGYMTSRQNIRTNQQRPAMNIAASPSQNMYSMQPPNPGTTMFIPSGHNVYQHAPQGQVIVQTAGQAQQMQVQFRQQMPQYAMPSTQGQYPTMAPNSATYYSPQPQQNNQSIYYPPAQNIPVQTTRAMPQQNVQTMPAAPSKRERKIISIVDPNTGKVINEDLSQNSSTPPQSGGSSARATPIMKTNTPPPPHSFAAPTPVQNVAAQSQASAHPNEIAAQFAAQVAASLATNTKPAAAAAAATPEPAKQPQQDIKPQVIASVQVEKAPSPPAKVEKVVSDSNSTVAVEANTETHSVKDSSPSASPSPSVPSSADTAEESPIAAPEVEESEVKTHETEEQSTVDAVVPNSVKDNMQPSTDSTDSKPEAEPEPEPPAVTVKEEPVSVVEEKVDSVETPEASSVTEEPSAVKSEPSSFKPEVRTNSVVEEKESVQTSKSETEKEAPAQAVKETEKVVAEVESPVQNETSKKEDESMETRDRRKMKKKQKELNEKGESKDTSDMEAFTDKPSSTIPEIKVKDTDMEERPVEEVSKPEPPPPQPVIKEPEPETKPESQPEPVICKVEIEVKDDKVAEKNEKNEEKSKAEIEKAAEPVIKKDKIELKYKYREDQWSPLNPEGKKQYDRDFLLHMQYKRESTTKPENLPKLPDVILDKPFVKSDLREKSQMLMGSGRGMVDFTPGFIRTSSPRPSMGKRNSQQRDKPPKKVITLSMQRDEITLHHSENAWKPASKTKESVDAETSKTQDLYRKTTSVLNKLTPQKFQTLIGQILQLEIDTEERLKGVIDLVFEKALGEPGFSVAYANMCKCMMQIKVPSEAKPGESAAFRPLLLNRCQREFEKDKACEQDFLKLQEEIDKAEEDKKPEMKEELSMKKLKARRRNLGNIRFIGELFKLKMLTENIMHDCLFKLLRANDEESLECLCRLLTTIGKDIDHEKAKPRVDQYFTQMEKIIKQKKTSSRVRFMLQDVCELRKSKWVPRRQDNNPKTIDQIHKEVAKEDQERDLLLQQLAMQKNNQPKKTPRDNYRGSGGMSGMMQSDDGWQSVGAKPQRAAIDPSKMKISQRSVDDNIQLGPGGRGFSKWGRGSSGGAKQNQESERTPTPTNRFSALSANADREDSRGRALGRGGVSGERKGSAPQLSGRSSGQKMFSRPSQEQERESALAAVRNMGRSDSRNRNTGSNAASRESSRNRDLSRGSREKPPTAVELNFEEFEKKTKAILDEYLQILDSKEAILCVKELQSPKNIHMFVTSAMNYVLERSAQARKQCGGLLRDLVKEEVLTLSSYVKGLQEVLEFAEDMEIDIPKIWHYLGELIAPMIHEGGVSMTFIKKPCEQLIESNKAGTLVANVLHEASDRMGHVHLGELWQAADLRWSDFLPSSVNIQEFITKNKVEFTNGSGAPKSPEAQEISIEKIENKLNELIVKRNSTNEEVFDWIEENVGEPKIKDPAFIRSLMSSVCTSAISGSGTSSKMETAKLTKRTNLLRKYLDHQAEFELQALYALQALVHKLDHPPGLLRTFFDTLYDEDVISEDAFNQWETSTDPAEQTGKGVAKNSVVQFFTWLREAEEESPEDS